MKIEAEGLPFRPRITLSGTMNIHIINTYRYRLSSSFLLLFR